MAQNNVLIRFNEVSFAYDDKKIILDEANFTVRKNSIVTIIGQNGAGKSTIFKLLMGKIKPQSGSINLELGTRIGIAEQMIPADKLDLTIKEYFQTAFPEDSVGIEGDMFKIIKTVNLQVPLTRKLKELSGGQKARVLLAYALISEPDVLLLDEPTNNLDKVGIEHLTLFLINYQKTCIVISHDADFLNCFTEGVLNLDVHTHKVEQFVGNYFDVLTEIEAKLERDRQANARLEKSIKDRFLKINKLGGKSIAMAQLARRIRKDIDEDREEIVEVRREDKTIPDFIIPNQDYVGYIIKIKKPITMELVKGMRLIVKGPNGVGKSTLLRSILASESADINPKIRIGYYSQDFSELNFKETAYESLFNIAEDKNTQGIYAVAARFLLSGEMLKNRIGNFSEGQKGLLCYARFVLQVPGLLILDEPTNHINFRHIPVIASAVNEYKGPIIFVSHLPDFSEKIKNTNVVELEFGNF
jgi:ATP-binding cassette, subfamily F, member 3